MCKIKSLKIILICFLILGVMFALIFSTACKKEKFEEFIEEAKKLEEEKGKEVTEEEVTEGQSEEQLGEEEKTTEEPQKEAVNEIAFSSDHEGISSIFSCLSDGTGLKKIYDSGFDDHHPSWNSDHTKIVFSSNADGDDDHDLYIYDVVNDEISKVMDREGLDTLPIFSPDDESIVFTGEFGHTEEGTNFEIFTINADGNNLKQLTDNPAMDMYPHYSPDGKTIIFTRGTHEKQKLFTMDLEGNNIVQLTNEGDWQDFDGTYSPDGNNIVFVSNRSGNYDIWVMPAHNSVKPVNLTNNTSFNSYPDYSPHGSMIVFTSDRDEEEHKFDIFVMDSNGENQTNVTPDLKGSYQGGPSW